MIEQYQNPYVVAQSSEDLRAAFIRKTYSHLALAVLAFVFIEYYLITQTDLGAVALQFLAKSSFMWLAVLGAFMVVSHIAHKMAMSSTSLGVQYGGLALYVVGESLIILPLLTIANLYFPGTIQQAALITGGLFLGLTAIAFTTRKDFSFLGGILKMGFIIALAVIVGSFFLPFTLSGMIFPAIMILLAAGSILYNTSNIIHHYQPTQYVAASLGLFASLALLFWYVLQLLMNRD